jgi:hypothetical protein
MSTPPHVACSTSARVAPASAAVRLRAPHVRARNSATTDDLSGNPHALVPLMRPPLQHAWSRHHQPPLYTACCASRCAALAAAASRGRHVSLGCDLALGLLALVELGRHELGLVLVRRRASSSSSGERGNRVWTAAADTTQPSGGVGARTRALSHTHTQSPQAAHSGRKRTAAAPQESGAAPPLRDNCPARVQRTPHTTHSPSPCLRAQHGSGVAAGVAARTCLARTRRGACRLACCSRRMPPSRQAVGQHARTRTAGLGVHGHGADGAGSTTAPARCGLLRCCLDGDGLHVGSSDSRRGLLLGLLALEELLGQVLRLALWRARVGVCGRERRDRASSTGA